MGQKVNPKIVRVGITRTWASKWFDDKAVGYILHLQQDVAVRRFLTKKLRDAGLDTIEIQRHGSEKKFQINVFAAKPGLVIGRGGAGVEGLKKELHDNCLRSFRLGEISLNINEISRPNLSANIMAQSIATDIEKRLPFKKTMKQAIGRAEKSGALGVKIVLSGRLNGAEIARREMLINGKLPLQTLRADIDFAKITAHTTFGAIGVKVWIYKGEVFDKVKS